MRASKNIKIFLNYFLGPIIFIWLSYAIYRQVMNQPNLEQTWKTINESFNGPLIVNLFAVLFLMIINWSIEAVKWKLSVQHVQPVSFLRSFKAVLSGVSFSVSTPNRIGEYFGRVLYMDEGKRLRVISLTILGSTSQLIITFFFGLIGLYFLRNSLLEAHVLSWPGWIDIILYGGTMAFVILTVLYFRLRWIPAWLEKVPGFNKYEYLITELGKMDATLLLKLLSISMLRYLVFLVQYYLLFRFFGVDISWWQGFCATAVVFFMMAIIPTIALFEVVQRIFVATAIFKVFTSNLVGVGFVTTTIWFINLVIPAVTGSLLILSVKIFRGKNESG